MPDDLVKCEPEELAFEGKYRLLPLNLKTLQGPPSESSSVTLTVRNTSPKDVVFKVKTNSPMRYVVSPNEDIIKARETKLIKGKLNQSLIMSPSFNCCRSWINWWIERSFGTFNRFGSWRNASFPQSSRNVSFAHYSVLFQWQLVDKSRISEKFFACTFPAQDRVSFFFLWYIFHVFTYAFIIFLSFTGCSLFWYFA